MGFNTSSQNTNTPWLKDSRSDVAISSDYWENPAASDELAKELKDTYHEVRQTLFSRSRYACVLDHKWCNMPGRTTECFHSGFFTERLSY